MRVMLIGSLDGSNTTFMLPTPISQWQLMLFLNGMLLISPGDYTLNGKRIMMTTAPQNTDSLVAFY